MATTLDSLQLRITADTGTAVSAIEALNKSMKKLGGKATTNGVERAVENMVKLSDASKKLTSNTGAMSEFGKAMTALKNLKLDTANKGVKEIGKGLNVASLNAFTLVGNLKNIVAAGKQIIDMVAPYIDEAANFEGIGERFMRGYQEYAEETYGWFQKLNTEMGLNVQRMMQYSSIYAQMLQGMGVSNQKDIASISTGLTELGYDIWAAYNDVYGSYEDVAAALKSGLAGQVRPLRSAGFDITNAALERTAALHGLEVKMSDLTQAEKTYLRYQTLVDQAMQQGIVGTYAHEMETAEGVMRTLAQEVRTLGQAFGSLFLPLLTKAIPIVTGFVEFLADAVRYIASLFGIQLQVIDFAGREFGAVTGFGDEMTESLEEAGGAAKELQKSILGFDELNVLSSSSSSGGGGGGGGGGSSPSEIANALSGLDVSSLWTDAIFENVSKKAHEVRDAIHEWIDGLSVVDVVLGVGGAGIVGALAAAALHAKAVQTALVGLAGISLIGVMEFQLGKEFANTGSVLDLIAEFLGLGAAGALGYVTMGPAGLVIGFGVTIATQILGYTSAIANGTQTTATQDLYYGIFTALEGAGAGAITGMMIGGLPGLVIGAVIGLAVTSFFFAGELNSAKREREIKEKLDEMFGGDYQASLKVYVDRLEIIANGEATVVAKAHEISVEVESFLTNFSDDRTYLEKEVKGLFSKLFNYETMDVSSMQRSMADYTRLLQESIRSGVVIDPATVKACEDLYNELLPKMEQQEKTLMQAVNLGQMVPKGLREGLNDTYLTGALAGDARALSYMVGMEMSQSTEALEALVMVEDLGKQFDQMTALGILANLDFARDAATGLIIGVRDAATGQIVPATTILKKNLVSMGMSAVDAFASDDVVYEAIASGKYVIDSMVNAISSKLNNDTTLKKRFSEAGTTLIGGMYESMRADISDFYSIGPDVARTVQSSLNAYGPIALRLRFKMDNNILKFTSYSDSLHFSVPGYEGVLGGGLFASGGFPTSGEIFMARENGMPEYVGSMGNRTAVANNDQIIEGIAQGVSDANEAQNALLREQNRLLAEILNQGATSGGGGTSSQDVVAALTRANQRAGRTIVNVGV